MRRPRRIESWMHVKDNRKLRRRRRDKHITQVQLAALVGITQQYVSALESGVDADCSERVAERICRYLDVDLEDYFVDHAIVRDGRIATSARGRSKAVA